MSEQIRVVTWSVGASQAEQVGAMRCELGVRQSLCEGVCPLRISRHLQDVDDLSCAPLTHCEVPGGNVARRVPLWGASGGSPLKSTGITFIDRRRPCACMADRVEQP